MISIQDITILNHITGELYPKIAEIYETESLAKFAFSILWQAAEFSIKHGVVMVFDY